MEVAVSSKLPDVFAEYFVITSSQEITDEKGTKT